MDTIVLGHAPAIPYQLQFPTNLSPIQRSELIQHREHYIANKVEN